MDFITSTILGGMLYDLLKTQAALSTEQLRQSLSDWVIDESVTARIIEQASYLPSPEASSKDHYIQSIENSPNWQSLLKEIKPLARTAVQHNEGVVAETISGGTVFGKVAGDNIQVQGDYHAAPKTVTPKKS